MFILYKFPLFTQKL